MCRSGAMSKVRLAGSQDNVSGWLGIRIMCLAGNQDNVSGRLGIRIMCLAGNQDNVSEWSGMMCQSGAG